MKKELTKIETLLTKTDVTYYKLHFGTQWFMVTPWHYSKAKLMEQFELIKECKEGVTYDIKWRVATLGSNKVTFLTHIKEEVVEFSWDEEEQGGEEQTPTPKPTPSTPVGDSHLQQDFFEDDDLDNVPF